jgi:hypothetical protein
LRTRRPALFVTAVALLAVSLTAGAANTGTLELTPEEA